MAGIYAELGLFDSFGAPRRHQKITRLAEDMYHMEALPDLSP
jgi:hypothetical protein